MKKYLAYCRVSTKAQEDRDNSLPTQKRIITEYAERKQFEIVEWYSEAKSGFKGKRTEFRNMLEHLKAPSIEGVVFHKLDRSSRNVGDFSLLDKLMTRDKKQIVVIEGEFDTNRAAGRIAFRNFCNMCVWYSENLSEEVTTKMEEVLMKGYYPTRAPIGYREGIKGQDDDFKRKYSDPILAPFVKESFELFATGNYSIRSLCEYMRQRGMTNKSNGQLRKGVFERMLRDSFYYGLMGWGKRRC
jgi:DNA invertase Pin-like site-specific DNA recombinase